MIIYITLFDPLMVNPHTNTVYFQVGIHWGWYFSDKLGLGMVIENLSSTRTIDIPNCDILLLLRHSSNYDTYCYCRVTWLIVKLWNMS